MTDSSLHTPVRETLRLRPGVDCAVAESGEVFLVARPHSESLGQLAAGQLVVLRELAVGCAADELTAEEVDQLLDRLRAGAWLATTVAHDGQPLYTLLPRRPCEVPEREVPTTGGITLSRFAVLRRDVGGMLLESARATCEVRIHDPRVLALVGSLTQETQLDGVAGFPAEAARKLVGDLWREGFVVHHADAEDEELRLAQWSAHELWFHYNSSQSAVGTANGFGGTSWAKGRFEPLSGRHESFDGPTVDLPQPDLDRLRATDPTLTAVIEDRESVRECDEDNPLTLDQLGEFLFRCARVRGTGWHSGQEVSDRPYPAGGSVHELEIYPLVRRVEGMDTGLYHYDAYTHQLTRVPENPVATRALLTWSGRPQVLLVVAARFGRLMWKYEGMGYALMLKHVGVLYQNMYLVATAMGLAPCALALGRADLFAEATGLDQLTESSVGAFGLGSRAGVDVQ